MVNADLAAGYQRVLILAPMADPSLDEQIAGWWPRVTRSRYR